MKIAVIGGVPQSLVGFRGELIKAMCELGHEVYGLAGGEEQRFTDALAKNGVQFVSYPIKRVGLNPFFDLSTFVFLYQWLRTNEIDCVFSYTAKPIIWGGLATRLARVKYFHAMVTGLGRQFKYSTYRDRKISGLIGRLYHHALKGADSVIFQNVDDQQFFIDNKIVPAILTHRVNGSGVDLKQYTFSETPQKPMVFLTVGRLLAEKGFREYTAAASLVNKKYPDVKFQIAGIRENGPGAITSEEIEAWSSLNYIDYLGQVDNAIEVLTNCSVFVLATYLREGLPRTILEALSIGRPVITTDTVGCRDAVTHNDNGLLVPSRNVEALADAMLQMIENPKTHARMGKRARAIGEERYDVNKVNEQMLKIMQLTN